MELKKACAKDIGIVLNLYEQLFAYYATQQPSYYKCAAADRDCLIKALENDMDAYFIAYIDGEPVGICRLSQKETPPVEFYVHHKFAVIIDMFVSSAHRGGGVGKALIDKAREWTKERGLDYLELRVFHLNEFARRFYEEEGFEVTAHTMRSMV